MSEWQPIKTAPKDGTLVLVYIAKSYSRDTKDKADKIHISRWVKEFNGFGVENEKYFPVTHWMPLPKRPTNDKSASA